MLAMYLLRWNNNLILALILSIAGLGLLLSLGFSIYGVVLEYNETKRRIREKKRRPGAGN